MNAAKDDKVSARRAWKFLSSLGCACFEQPEQIYSFYEWKQGNFSNISWSLWTLFPPHTLNAGTLTEGLVLSSPHFNSFPWAVSVTCIALTIKQRWVTPKPLSPARLLWTSRPRYPTVYPNQKLGCHHQCLLFYQFPHSADYSTSS